MIRAATATANGTAARAYPTNITGGWMTIQGSCNSGLRPAPSAGMPLSMAKGDTRMSITPRNAFTVLYTAMAHEEYQPPYLISR